MGHNLYGMLGYGNPESQQKIGYRQPENQTPAYKPSKNYMRIVGTEDYWNLPWLSESEKIRAKEVFDWEMDDGDLVLLIPPEKAVWGYHQKQVQKCAFTATQDYLRSMLGPKLDMNDEVWYGSHPKTTSTGLPQEYTITVLNDLVKEYGIGVSHIYCQKGSSATEEQRAWQKVLGVNPIALKSRDCSNEEYLKKLNPSGDPEIDEALRPGVMENHFEYVDEFAGPAVIFSAFGVATSFAGGGGHASYIGPRGLRNQAAMAIRFDWLSNIKYKENPPTIDYSASAEKKLKYTEVLDKNGKKYSESVEGKGTTQNYQPNTHYNPKYEQSPPSNQHSLPQGNNKKNQSRFLTVKESVGLIKSFKPNIPTIEDIHKGERKVTEDNLRQVFSSLTNISDELEVCLTQVAGYWFRTADSVAEYQDNALANLDASTSIPSIRQSALSIYGDLGQYLANETSKYSLSEILLACKAQIDRAAAAYSLGERFWFRLVAQSVIEELKLDT